MVVARNVFLLPTVYPTLSFASSKHMIFDVLPEFTQVLDVRSKLDDGRS